jgi:hypothetical protein
MSVSVSRLCGGVLVALVLALAGCGGDGGSEPTPIDPLSKATLVVDGQSFQPSPKGMSALDHGSNNISVMVHDCAGTYISLSLRSPLAVGTVAAADIFQAALFKESGGQFAGQWDWVRGQGRGTLTLTGVSPRIVGTFEFDMPPLAGTGATGTKFVQGSFDVSFGNGTVCK